MTDLTKRSAPELLALDTPEASADSLWQPLYLDHFGDPSASVLPILAHSGIPISTSDLTPCPPPGTLWKTLYLEREQASKDPSFLTQAKEYYAQAMELLNEFSSRPQAQLLVTATDLLIRVVDRVPDHAPSYLALAVACFAIQADWCAKQLVEAGKVADPEFADLEAFEESVLADAFVDEATEGLSLPDGFEGVLDERKNLVPSVRWALVLAFERFDADGDGVLNETELTALVKCCNPTMQGELPREFVEYLGASFEVSEDGELTLRGLMEFYAHQSMLDPKETLKDLGMLSGGD